ncbi:uncharacterized protein BJ212DRAFT_1395314 [Suillus subaureus]|uniref:Secreted protein n=1 Tax=Suillus subaureus TaxID=48587 RepID=A0A9P7DVB5_9AGAM|nr:uncharacterized protein BJ212DRAFT_1395314 [Suillus subaureus]KAG1803971.1 hypothetical protein BJ212DRAFT_1395314 [Suillus subaureus]
MAAFLVCHGLLGVDPALSLVVSGRLRPHVSLLHDGFTDSMTTPSTRCGLVCTKDQYQRYTGVRGHRRALIKLRWIRC